MQAVWYERNGAARDVLIFGETPEPEPGPGEVRVRIQASGVNPSDWKTRSGYRPMFAPRVIPHSDGAGIIDRVGEGVEDARVGERVWIWNAQWNRAFGTAAQFVTLPSVQAVRLPDGTPMEAGACLGIPALTAHRALTVDGSVEGRTVLVAGGAGAVGQYVIQFAKFLGAAQVIATVSSSEKAEHAHAAGADKTINYKTESVADVVQSLTGGRGADRVIEVDISGNAALVSKVLARDGLCVAYGTSKRNISLEFLPMVAVGAGIRFIMVYDLSEAARKRGIADLTAWMESGKLRHAVGATLPLERTAEAHELSEMGRVIGNVVVQP